VRSREPGAVRPRAARPPFRMHTGGGTCSLARDYRGEHAADVAMSLPAIARPEMARAIEPL